MTMLYGRTTLSKFIIEEQRRLEGGADLIALVNDIQTACKYIASAVARGALNELPSRSALGGHAPLGRPGGLTGVPSRCALRYSPLGRPGGLMAARGGRCLFPMNERFPWGGRGLA